MSLLEFWRTKTERRELLQRSNEKKLSPAELKQLLGDSGVRAALGESGVASLLPPVGSEVFRRFTAAALEEGQACNEAEEGKKTGQGLKPASELKAGKPLPFFFGDPPSELLNTPLEELDPYYQSKQTFLVLGSGHIIHRFDCGAACSLFSPLHPLRTWAIKVLLHSLFRFLIITTILINCFFMVLKQPPDWTFYAELVFFVVYCLEVLIKVMSRGVCCGKFSFLRDPWNWLDVLVITTTVLSEFLYWNVLFAVALVVRILKLFPLIPGMKSTLRALVRSGKRLAGVAVMMVFFLFVFALIGQQLFMGNLRQKCYMWPINVTDFYLENGSRGFDYNQYLENHTNQYFLPGQLDALLCGNSSDAGTCPEGFTCMKGSKNPNYGYTSFDWFGPSLLSMIRLMSRDYWENLVMLTLRSAGKSYVIVFLLVFFPGCFGLLCLIVAAVAMAIGKQEQAVVAKARLRNKVYNQIQEALKSSNKEEEATSSAAHSDTKDDEQDVSKTQPRKVEGSEDKACSPCCRLFINHCLKWNCCGCWRRVKQHLYSFVTSPFFNLGIVLILIINIIFMAMEHYPMSPSFEEMLAVGNLVFTFIYLVEMLLKIVAMDPYGYYKVSWNVFESFLVAFSILEFIFVDVEGMSILRSTRLLRIFRLARWWPSFHLFLKLVGSSLGPLRNLTLTLLIVIFSYSVLGMQLFQSDYRQCVCRISVDCELPRWHMNDFYHTFLLVIRTVFNGWMETLWDCMEVSGPFMCVPFFVSLVIIGRLLVLGLFLSLLLSWASTVLTLREKPQGSSVKSAMIQSCRDFWDQLGQKKPNPSAAGGKDDDRTDGLALDVVTSDTGAKSFAGEVSPQPDIESQRAPIAEIEELKTQKNKEINGDDEQKHPEVQPAERAEDLKGNTLEDCCCEGCYRCCPLLDLNKSQSLGRIWSNFRRSCLHIVQHPAFEAFIILNIVLSSTALVFEDMYLPERRTLKTVVETSNLVFTFVFLLEMVLKWSALGLKKYFTNPWCFLDFLILMVTLCCLIAAPLGFPEFGASICSLRALIPLRILSRALGLRVVVGTVVRSLPSLVDVILVALTVWLFFGIMGVNMFAGKFYYCFNETSEEYFDSDDVNNKTECFTLMWANFTEIRWKNLYLTFDDVSSGFLSLFVLAASTDWFDLMYGMSDTRRVEDQPIYEVNLYTTLFVVLFIIPVFFTFNFIVGAIVWSLHRDWSAGKPLFATENQLISIKALKTQLSNRKPNFPVPESSCRVWLYKLVTSRWFEVFMVVVICLNMVALMAESDQQSSQMDEILHWFQFAFLIIYLIEFILNIIALGRHYFTSNWNIVAFVVLLMLIAGLFIADFLEKYFVSPTLYRIILLTRIFKVFHLIPRSRGIRKLLWAFFVSLPAIFNIILLLSVLMFCYSIFGMFSFPYLKRVASIDDMWNFETFWSSLICLILSTPPSPSWTGLLLPMMQRPPDCDPFPENPGLTNQSDCGNPMVGTIFFVTFISLSYLLLGYLVIAIILEAFHVENEDQLSDQDLAMFYKTWKKFDPDASGCIQNSELSDFCSALKDPLKIPKPNSTRLTNMNLPLLPGDKIRCEDVLLALNSEVYGDSADVDSLRARLEKKFTSKASCEPISSTLQRKQEEGAGESADGTDGV